MGSLIQDDARLLVGEVVTLPADAGATTHETQIGLVGIPDRRNRGGEVLNVFEATRSVRFEYGCQGAGGVELWRIELQTSSMP
jgi:hypothetical protein